MLVGISMPNSLHMPFKVGPGVLNKTLSHICGKLNLPLFLFIVGLLTVINMPIHVPHIKSLASTM